MIISPSLLSANLYHLEADMVKMRQAEWLHIDTMDGSFVPNLTFGANLVSAIRPHTDQFLDCHLMVDRPDTYVQAFADAGADALTIPFESSIHAHRTLQHIKSLDMKAGLAINPGTAVESTKALLPFVDLILVMTVNPGFGGQAFIPEMLSKIYMLDDLRRMNHSNYLISVDGGINHQTGQLCAEAGADVLVSGSYLFNQEDPEQAILDLQAL